ncbi:ABC transporter permease [Diaphorobacter aerolatus]|uniref:Transport permease protein n=2 Tax=Diaphorobacter aerolatus TaxID=1288495 RepID=A0A7H0GQ95_9BURK|nr:ABC transporter permease [Diaphorobacter aerolatus]
MREFHGKYRESLLGAFWSVANPLAMILIYTLVMGQLMRPTLPGYEKTPFAFPIYLCAGVITWNLFADIVSRLNGVFVDNGNLIKKSNFPRICLPAIVVTSAFLNFGIVMAIYLAFLAIIGYWPGWSLLSIIPLLIILTGFAVGLGVLLGTLNVFFRDVGQLTGVILQFWFWLTPIVYTFGALTEKVRIFMGFNPMVPLMQGFQQIFLMHSFVSLKPLIPLTIATLILLTLAAWFFSARVGELVDEL